MYHLFTYYSLCYVHDGILWTIIIITIIGAERRGACCDSVKKVRPHHASAERIPLAAHGTACAVQADADCFQVPPWPVAPSYLTDDCVLVSCVAGRRPLRSVDTRTLYVPRTRTAIGARNFAVAGPRVWNSLPPELRMLNCILSAPLRRN